MPGSNNLMMYGIAINFFGNYRNEASYINTVTQQIHGSLLSLQDLLVGGSFVAAITKFGSSLMGALTRVELQFAQLKTSLGSVTRAVETLQWAKRMGLETALEGKEVVDAVVSMTRMGLASDKENRERNFKYLADFTAQFAKPRGMTFEDVVDAVTKASFGNWERLGDNFGIRKLTIGTQWQNALRARGIDNTGRNPLAFTDAEVKRADALLNIIKTGKQGSDELKFALVEMLGIMSKGGMNEQLRTVAGTWSNILEITDTFLENLVGITQVQGSLANQINRTLNQWYNIFAEKNAQGESALNNLMRFARDIGEVFKSMWSGVDSTITGYIQRVSSFLRDYRNNVAPFLVFIMLLRIEVEEFFKGFVQGFQSGFRPFLDAAIGVWKVIGEIIKFLGISRTTAEALGKALGVVMGILVGIRAFRFIVSPLTRLVFEANLLRGRLLACIELIRIGESWTIAESVQFRWALFSRSISRLIPMLSGAATASWAFTASLLANPITWIVIAVVALVAWLGYLIYNWEEVGKRMQSVNDTWLVMLSIFAGVIGIPLLLAKYWQQFSSIFKNIWAGIRDYTIGVGMVLWAWIKNAIGFLAAPFVYAYEKMGQFFNYLGEKFPWLGTLFNGVKDMIKGVTDWVVHLWDSIVGFFSDIGGWVGKLLGWTDDATKSFAEGGSSFRERIAREYGYNTDQMVVNTSPVVVNAQNRVSPTTLPTNQPIPSTVYNFHGGITVKANDEKQLYDSLKNSAARAGK